jgi:hypothetical protein
LKSTIKFGPAVSQKEMEKRLFDDSTTSDDLKTLRKIKARIELVADIEDIKSVAAFIKKNASG